ncbi:hypothetical protein Nepgr_007899 [Nepenthes gracilis]|uniref:Uncharacterized protein n=1 Tax=Nepenthes gracilis TaxID=150966 RepID=A0AAD3XIR9_NEPGR|nr:hypothetical protein Nepgr_007899 [Nepenthes gracilis]
MVPASGMFGGLEELSFVPKMIVSASEVTCPAPSDNSTSGFGLDSKSAPADVVSVTIPVAVYSDAGSIGAVCAFCRNAHYVRGLYEGGMPSSEDYEASILSLDVVARPRPDGESETSMHLDGAPAGLVDFTSLHMLVCWNGVCFAGMDYLLCLNLWHAVTSAFEQEASDANHKVPSDAKPQNPAPGVGGVESGTSPLVSPSAIRSTPCVKIRPKVEQPSCLSVVFDAISLESKVENHKDSAFDEQMVPASGMSSGLEELSFVLEMIVSAPEVTCLAPSDNSTSRFGLHSKPPPADAVSATVSVAVCLGLPEMLWADAPVRGQMGESETSMHLDGAPAGLVDFTGLHMLVCRNGVCFAGMDYLLVRWMLSGSIYLV